MTVIVDPPLTVTGPDPPLILSVGDVDEGAVTVKFTLPDVPPPGAGVETEIASDPALATSLAGIAAVSVVADMNVVERGDPLTRTCDAATKPVPVTVRVNAGEPAGALVGEIDDTAGVGLLPPDTVTTGLVASKVQLSF